MSNFFFNCEAFCCVLQVKFLYVSDTSSSCMYNNHVGNVTCEGALQKKIGELRDTDNIWAF